MPERELELTRLGMAWQGAAGCGVAAFGAARSGVLRGAGMIQNGETMLYPLDWNELKKGDEFSPQSLQEILGKQPGTEEFRFACMSLQALIQEKTSFTVKIQADESLRILTDSEAAEHNRRLFVQYMRGMMYRHELNAQVEVENLTEAERKKHDRTLMAQSRYVSALARATKSLTLKPAKARPLPAALEKKKEGKE